MPDLGWLIVPRWHGRDGFQHYRDRDPLWIKNYTRLLSSDEYLELSAHRRGLLHGIWLEYARSDGRLRGDTTLLARRLNAKVTVHDLESLNHAGFIEFSASRPLAIRKQAASAETEVEKEKNVSKGLTTARAREGAATNSNGEAELELLEAEAPLLELVGVDPPRRRPADPRARAGDGTSGYTGCRQTRGAGGLGYVRDVLGIDRPPADWPHPAPSAREVADELRRRRGEAG